MKVIIIGCGRVGSSLAQTLSQRGDTVVVIDSDPTAFERLGPTFKGRTISGVGFDRDVLLQAGIEHADALAAVTVSDEANVTAARLARQVFKVPRVAVTRPSIIGSFTGPSSCNERDATTFPRLLRMTKAFRPSTRSLSNTAVCTNLNSPPSSIEVCGR